MPRDNSRFGRRKPRLAQDGDPFGLVARKAEFLEWLKVKNRSPETLKTYDSALEQFLAWSLERGLTRPSEVNLAILERYQRWLFHYRKQGGATLSFTSQQTRLHAVKTFFRYLARAHLVLSNPAADLVMPKAPLRLPRAVLTAQQAERVLALPDVATVLGLRDRTILETFYATGIRRSELCQLSVYDLDRARELLSVREGKGAKDRVVPTGERALHWLERYLTEVRPQLVVEPDPQTLFLSAFGEPLRADTLTRLVGGYVERAELGKLGACHLFRHTMATLMLEGGADVRFIQEMLGHRSVETTQVYTRVSPQKLKAIHAATHPAAKLGAEPGKPPVASEDASASAAAEKARDEVLARLLDEAQDEEQG